MCRETRVVSLHIHVPLLPNIRRYGLMGETFSFSQVEPMYNLSISKGGLA